MKPSTGARDRWASLRTSILESWGRFWYAEGSTFSLGLFRILFAVCLFLEIPTTRYLSAFAVEGGFHLPYVPLLQPITPDTYEVVLNLQYPLIGLLAIGLFMRFSCSALIALQGFIFFIDQLNFRNHPYFFLLVLLLLLLSPADESLSVKSVIRMMKDRRFTWPALIGPQRPLTFQRLIQVQVSIVYVFAALHKLHPAYLRGETLAFLMGENLLYRDSGAFLGRIFDPPTLALIQEGLQNPAIFFLPALLTVWVEFVLAFTLWFRRTRTAFIIIGCLFHLTIAFLMNIYVFSYAMMASYLLFLDPETLPSMVRARLERKEIAVPIPSPSRWRHP